MYMLNVHADAYATYTWNVYTDIYVMYTLPKQAVCILNFYLQDLLLGASCNFELSKRVLSEHRNPEEVMAPDIQSPHQEKKIPPTM